MTRSREERLADVRRLLAAAEAVYGRRSRLRDRIASTTGLSPSGVDLGFESLEREATDAELRKLVDAAGDADHVHVVLSANVFVAPLRALALARAAAPRVTVRPSPRDPVLTAALLETVADPGLQLVEERDVARVVGDANGTRVRVDVYGRDVTIAGIRAAVAPTVEVRGHGAGMGIAVVVDAAASSVAERIARDVVAFDQRGCLSPRVVFLVGDPGRAHELSAGLDAALRAADATVPRGELSREERAEAVRWQDVVSFGGRTWSGAGHVVGLLPSFDAHAVAPAGRHVLVVAVPSVDALTAVTAPISRHVVAVGCDDASIDVSPRARRSPLGEMQRPPLDGPVDRRVA